MAWIKSLKQGDCDYFCCLYSITNALSKLSSSKLGYKSQIYVFNRLLEKLVSIGGLQNIEKKGVPYTKAVKLLKTTQKILFDKYKLKIEISEPFYGQEPDIEKLKTFLKAKNTAVILSISENGGMKHWSVLDKISAKEVSFYDSWVYDKVKLRNIPQPSKLDDIFIMSVQTEYTVLSQMILCVNKVKNRIYCTPVNASYKFQFHIKEQKI